MAYPLLKDTLRYGNLADPGVNADYFVQYNLSASRAREAFARVARKLLQENQPDKAREMLDRGLEVLPSPKIRYTDANTYPFIECYYLLEDYDKGDALLKGYAETLKEYIEYYLQFDGAQAALVSDIITEKLDSLYELYYLAAYARRDDLVKYFNEYFRTFGYTDEELIQPGTDAGDLMDAPVVNMQ